MISLPSSYTLNLNFSGTSLTFTEPIFDITDGTTANRDTEDLEKVPDLEHSYSTIVNTITSTETSYVLYSRQKFSFEAYSTCTFDENITHISYEIISSNGQEVPDWITLNSSTGKYEGRAPRVVKEKVYSFILKSTWKSASAGESEQEVLITVNNDVPLTTAGMVASSASTGAVASGGGAAAGASL